MRAAPDQFMATALGRLRYQSTMACRSCGSMEADIGGGMALVTPALI